MHRPRVLQVVPLPCGRRCTGKGTPPSQKRKDQEGTVPWRHKGLGNPKTFINEGSLAREHVGSLRESGTFIVLVPVATCYQEPCNSINIQYSTLLDCTPTIICLLPASYTAHCMHAKASPGCGGVSLSDPACFAMAEGDDTTSDGDRRLF